MSEKNNIEDVFKKTFEKFEADVKSSTWSNIQTAMKGAGLGLFGKLLINKIGVNTIITVASSAVAVVGTVVVMNWNSSKNENTTKEATKTSFSETKKEPTVVSKEDDSVSELKTTSETQKVETTENTVELIKKDQKKINSVISSLSDKPIATISASPIGGSVPLIVNLSNTGIGKTNKWIYSDGKTGNTERSLVHIFEKPGTYTVTLISTDENGKTSTDKIKVEVTGNSSIASIPREFSPNGDGVNDIFVFQSKNIVKMNAIIFDKKGNVIYDWEGKDGHWDGTTKAGKKAPEGEYFYIITAQGLDGKKYEQKGAINLTRGRSSDDSGANPFM